MIRLFLILFFFIVSCNTKITYSPQCNFPASILEQGGLIKSNYDQSLEDKFIFKKNIICYEGKVKKILSPISYFSKKNLYKENGLLLSEVEFRESRLFIKDKKFINLSNENLQRIKEESKLLNSKILLMNNNSKIKFPLYRPALGIISSEYGVKRFINDIPRNPHLGLDIASKIGTPIYSAESGLVVLTEDFFYRGKNILIDHSLNFKTAYSHLDEILVKEGDLVERGEIIGFMGKTGRVTGSHLHFEVIFLGERLNPIYFLSKD